MSENLINCLQTRRRDSVFVLAFLFTRAEKKERVRENVAAEDKRVVTIARPAG